MADESETRYETLVETNRWESFTRLTFAYFADRDYEVDQLFHPGEGTYELVFTDAERDETAVFVYEGSPPDMAQESLQQMQKLFQGTADISSMWTEMLDATDG